MGWTYDITKLATVSREQVRFLIRDTDTARQMAQDEEIDWALTQEMNIYMAAAAVLIATANRSHGVSSKSVGSLSLSFEGPDAMLRRAELLRARGRTYQKISAGGISLDDRNDLEKDSDLIQPHFAVGKHDNPAGSGLLPANQERE